MHKVLTRLLAAMFVLASLSISANADNLAPFTPIPVGFISYDVTGANVAQVDIVNFTGANASTFPDTTFPISTPLSLALLEAADTPEMGTPPLPLCFHPHLELLLTRVEIYISRIQATTVSARLMPRPSTSRRSPETEPQDFQGMVAQRLQLNSRNHGDSQLR